MVVEPGGEFEVRPLVEVGYVRIGEVGGGLFDVGGVYGGDHVWSLALGVRLTLGTPMHRMGRYGAAVDAEGVSLPDHRGMTR